MSISIFEMDPGDVYRFSQVSDSGYASKLDGNISLSSNDITLLDCTVNWWSTLVVLSIT